MRATANPSFAETWRPAAHWLQPVLPRVLRPWLLDSASLTQRLIRACCEAFRVELLGQSWRRPLLTEARALEIDPDRYAWVRQVRLLCGQVPWVYARTVIPGSTLTGPQRRLTRLRTRSLGAVLFADPTMERGTFQIARLLPGDTLFTLAAAGLARRPSEIWGRRAIFRVNDKPLLVSEIFLPALGEFPPA